MKKNYCFMLTATVVALFSTANVTAQQTRLITVATFGKYQPIGCKAARTSNRVFVSFPHHGPFRYALMEITGKKRIPFPDTGWNKYKPADELHHFVNVQDLYIDDKNCLWVLDSSPAGHSSIFGEGKNNRVEGHFKLVQIDLSTNTVKRIYTFNNLDKSQSALNDVRIDNQHQLAYLSDPGLRAIVVLDLRSGTTRTLLKHTRFTTAAPGFVLHLDGKAVADGQGHPFISNVNGIALTYDDRYFYFRPINDSALYRIRTFYLADASLTDAELATQVQTVALTGVCHGMAADAKGNIYLSDSPDHAIRYVSPDGKIHLLVKDKRIIWPDSMGVSGSGFLYFSCSQMNRLPQYNNGQDMTAYPYAVYKVKLPKGK